MKAHYVVLSFGLILYAAAGCASQKSLEAPLDPSLGDYVERLPQRDHFREVVRKITEFHVSYRFSDQISVIRISESADVAEMKELLLASDIFPEPSVTGLGAEPYLSAFNRGERLFDVRWQYRDRVRVLADRYHDWLGTYRVSEAWRAKYLAFCSRIMERDAAQKRPNQSPEPTALLVTPRADARVAPSNAVAHL